MDTTKLIWQHFQQSSDNSEDVFSLLIKHGYNTETKQPFIQWRHLDSPQTQSQQGVSWLQFWRFKKALLMIILNVLI